MSENGSESGVMGFKEIVHEWIEIHDCIKNLQGIIRNKRNRMNQLQHHILLFMKQNDKQICNVGENNALVVKTRKSTSTIKKSDVLSLLSKYMSEDDALNKTSQFFENRPTKLKEYVQLTAR